MSHYSLRNILKQKPNTISQFVLTVLAVLIMTGVVQADEKVVAGIGLAVSMFLSLFYVTPLTTANDTLDKLAVQSWDYLPVATGVPTELDPDEDEFARMAAQIPPFEDKPDEDSVGRTG